MFNNTHTCKNFIQMLSDCFQRAQIYLHLKVVVWWKQITNHLVWRDLCLCNHLVASLHQLCQGKVNQRVNFIRWHQNLNILCSIQIISHLFRYLKWSTFNHSHMINHFWCNNLNLVYSCMVHKIFFLSNLW